MSEPLFSRSVGDEGAPVVVMLHGLLGQARNLATVAKGVADAGFRVLTYDLPNHGRSPWTDEHDYAGIAAAVEREVRAAVDGPVALLGHSMGGKAAMHLALSSPDLVSRLVVVDISPVDYGPTGTGHEPYFTALRGLDLAAVTSREDADAQLREAAPEDDIRGFLLQNLARAGDGFTWRANLEVLARDLPQLARFDVPAGTAPYDGPVLWLAGGASPYVQDSHREAMDAWFPRARLVRFKGVGHWVHAQVPELFIDAVTRFLLASAR